MSAKIPISPELQRMQEIRPTVNISQRRIKYRKWLERNPDRPCRACGEIFRPPFKKGWHLYEYCPREECQEEKARNIYASMLKGIRKYIHQLNEDLKEPINNLWPCRTCGKMTTSRLDCPKCVKEMAKEYGEGLDMDYEVLAIPPSEVAWM